MATAKAQGIAAVICNIIDYWHLSKLQTKDSTMSMVQLERIQKHKEIVEGRLAEALDTAELSSND